MKLGDIDTVRRRRHLPPLLLSLIESGMWIHPGVERLRDVAPYIRDPLVILPSVDSMLFNSGPLMGPTESENESFHEYRGSVSSARDLPWIDVEKTIFIMCNERAGDDCGIALDYRPDPLNPRVICSDWHTGFNGVKYRQIATSFDDFADKVGLRTNSQDA